jgi:hypothetical protein
MSEYLKFAVACDGETTKLGVKLKNNIRVTNSLFRQLDDVTVLLSITKKY